MLFVDTDLLAASGTARALLFVEADLFFVAGVASVGTGGGEGFVELFVTFPSDVRSLRREVGLSFYLDCCRFCGDSVTPIRGREDTEGDRYAGVKVQVGWSRGVLSCMPLEPLREQFERKTRKNFLAPFEGDLTGETVERG